MLQNQVTRRKPSVAGSLKALEADISYANTLADGAQKAYGGACLRMRLSYSILAPIVLFFVRCLDCSCSSGLLSYLGIFHVVIHKVRIDGAASISSHERRATLREFYAVIYPSLQQFESNLVEREESSGKAKNKQIAGGKRTTKDWKNIFEEEMDREDECGICLEVCPKMVLPSCIHAMCINCYHDWNVRSQSCPFCRGSLKRVSSGDLWVLMSDGDVVVDTMTLEKDDWKRLCRYIDCLPLLNPRNLHLVYYGYLF